jgi:hypothetical protein
MRHRQVSAGACAGRLVCVLATVAASAAPARAQPLAGFFPELGRGFDTSTGWTSSPCIAGIPVLRGNRSGSVSFHFDESFADYLQTTDGRLGAGVDLGIIGGGVAVDFFARVARTELSTSLTIGFDGAMGTAVLTEPRLTAEGRAAADMTPERRRSTCGDGFISSVDLGSRLYISATLHFKDEETFERFVKTVEVSALFGLVRAKKTFVDETRHFAQDAYLKIDGLQEGGDPSRLHALLASDTSLCRLDNIDACHVLLTRLLAYAGSPEGYASQFSRTYAAEELAPLRFHSATYAASGVEELAAPKPILDDEFRALLRRLAELRARDLFLVDRASLLLGTPLSVERREALTSFRALAQENIDAINRALWVCQSRGADTGCRDAADRAARDRHPLTAAKLYF